ncbi:MAG TPA: phospholipid carrier-dependent glycosyltransferase, partial [Candidatus Limnocylindrales bacterium]|nr:phospholipid carrier-dependent glycosyltransferase [Candidatus Limnocylindrales bacterium]
SACRGSAGSIFRLDTQSLDASRDGDSPGAGLEAFSAGPGAPVERLVVTDTSLVAISRGSISTFDTETGSPLSERFAFAATDATPLPWVERVMVDTRLVTDKGQTTRRLARALGDEPADETPLASDGRGAARAVADEEERIRRLLEVEGFVVVDAYLEADRLDRIRADIEQGSLPGVSIKSAPLLAVAGHSGVSILDAWTLDSIAEIPTDEPVSSLVLVERGLSEPTLYAAAGASLEIVPILDEGPDLPSRLAMPGELRDLVWNEPANLVHALGDAPEGGPTVYVVEPHGNAVFIDVPLPSGPDHLLADTQPERPAEDRGELLAIGADGVIASVGIDGNAFGWRLPGMLLGALMAGLLYLLARVLFARRSIALIAAILVVAEGMLFANSRIGMNDVYVTTFIVGAALLFAPLYLGPRRPWTAVALLLGAGLCLGLALASKWVALYAIGGLVFLVLSRSALGRTMALLGMIALTAALGAMAIRAPPVDDPSRNWVFLLVMLLLTGSLAAGIVRRPLAFTRGEVWFATLGPVLLGWLLIALDLTRGPAGAEASQLDALGSMPWQGGLLVAGGLLVLSGLSVGLLAWLAGRSGRGPFATVANRTTQTSSSWLHPGRLAGLPWLFTLACLTLVPVAVYIVSYAPWVELGNQWGLPLLGSLPLMPEGSQTGRTLADLTSSIYQYHDNLRAEHAASSPWWAWPLDLKPVWFFSEQYVGSRTGLIYDAGNLLIFWLGLVAMAFAGWAAWHRRSRSLAMAAILWAALWLPWARIDRATFQYHVFASLPFMVLALSYLLAELWHGPSARTWFLARAAAGLAILGVPLLWLLRTPLCILAGTAVAHPEGVACASQVTRTAQVSEAGTAALAVVAAGAVAAGLLGWRASRGGPGQRGRGGGKMTVLVWVLIVTLVTLGGVMAALLLLDSSTTVALTLSSDVIATAGLVVLAVPAWLVLRAHDPRRLVVAALGAAVLWLLIWYPNLSGLPLPSDLAPIYQGLLPTWNWDFQFAVNTDPAVEGRSIDLDTLVVAAVTTAFVIGVAIASSLWGRSGRDPEPAAASAPFLPGVPRP